MAARQSLAAYFILFNGNMGNMRVIFRYLKTLAQPKRDAKSENVELCRKECEIFYIILML